MIRVKSQNCIYILRFSSFLFHWHLRIGPISPSTTGNIIITPAVIRSDGIREVKNCQGNEQGRKDLGTRFTDLPMIAHDPISGYCQ